MNTSEAFGVTGIVSNDEVDPESYPSLLGEGELVSLVSLEAHFELDDIQEDDDDPEDEDAECVRDAGLGFIIYTVYGVEAAADDSRTSDVSAYDPDPGSHMPYEGPCLATSAYLNA